MLLAANAALGELVGDTHYHCVASLPIALERTLPPLESPTRSSFRLPQAKTQTATWVDPLEKAEARAAAAAAASAAAETAAGAAGAAGAAADAAATTRMSFLRRGHII